MCDRNSLVTVLSEEGNKSLLPSADSRIFLVGNLLPLLSLSCRVTHEDYNGNDCREETFGKVEGTKVATLILEFE